MKLGAKLKKKIDQFLSDVARENQKSFGGQPDCCSLNNQNRKVKAPARNGR